jgi:hypothetical protein
MKAQKEDPEGDFSSLFMTPRDQFMLWCRQGYELIEQGAQVSDLEDPSQANLAMRRMLGLFIDTEEYEKCGVLKIILEREFPGNTSPVFDYREIWARKQPDPRIERAFPSSAEDVAELWMMWIPPQ